MGHSRELMRACLTVSLLLAGCIDYGQYEDFFRLRVDEQQQAIKKYSLDEQVDIYLLSERGPTRPSLAGALGENGGEIVPVLTGRLTQSQNASDKIALLNVFSLMEAMGSYPVAADDMLMQILDHEAASIASDAQREYAILTVAAIRGMEERKKGPFIQHLRKKWEGALNTEGVGDGR